MLLLVVVSLLAEYERDDFCCAFKILTFATVTAFQQVPVVVGASVSRCFACAELVPRDGAPIGCR